MDRELEANNGGQRTCATDPLRVSKGLDGFEDVGNDRNTTV